MALLRPTMVHSNGPRCPFQAYLAWPPAWWSRTGRGRLFRELAADPALQGGAALDADDGRIPRLRPGVETAVVQRLGIEDYLLAAGQRDPGLCLAVKLGRADDQHAGGVVGPLQPHPHDPAAGLRVAPVVVIQVQPPA